MPQDRAIDALKELEKAAVSTNVLAETQAGKRVRALTKHRNTDIAAAAGTVVDQWKRLVRRESMGGSEAISNPESPATIRTVSGGPPKRNDSQANVVNSSATASRAASQQASELDAETAALKKPNAADLHDIPFTGDGVRDKCRAHLAAALQKSLEEGADGGDPVELGVAIEIALHAAHTGVTPAYKAKFRQLHFNLKDDKNPDLRRRVLEGTILPDVLITLAPEELASDLKREENQKIRERKLFDAAPSAAKQATTDQFQCGKCRQRKCTYYQMQTRSADEPMTT